VREGKAPKPRQLSDRRVGWLVRELEEWVEGRPASELLPPANTGAPKAKNAGIHRPLGPVE
jgi:prophage regulatory protein